MFGNADFSRLAVRELSLEPFNRKVPEGPTYKITIFRATPAEDTAVNRKTYQLDDVATLLHEIDENGDLFHNGSDNVSPSLNLIFFPKEEWSQMSKGNPSSGKKIFDCLHLDHAIFSYMLSHRTAWCHVPNNDGSHSFMVKSYIYMLAWSFNPRTLETRAMLSERSEYGQHSVLKNNIGEFDLPGLNKSHLYHPLSLACVALVDIASYFEWVLVKYGEEIGKIEKATGHGLWVEMDEQKSRNDTETVSDLVVDIPTLISASQRIAKIIGVFANFFKDVKLADSIATTLEDTRTWKKWFKRYNDNEERRHKYDECALPFDQATALLRQRIKTLDSSGGPYLERAKAQSSVVSALAQHLVEASNELAKDMKIIALLTMFFLPATFFAALFAVPLLDWDQAGGKVIKSGFWIYWACTITVTLALFITWDLSNGKKQTQKLLRFLKSCCARLTPATSKSQTSDDDKQDIQYQTLRKLQTQDLEQAVSRESRLAHAQTLFGVLRRGRGGSSR